MKANLRKILSLGIAILFAISPTPVSAQGDQDQRGDSFDSHGSTGSAHSGGSHSSSLGPGGYQANAEWGGTASVAEGSYQGSYHTGFFETGGADFVASGRGIVGAQTNVGGQVSFGPQGLGGGGNASIFVGSQGQVVFGGTVNFFGLAEVTMEISTSAGFGLGAQTHANLLLSGGGFILDTGASTAAGPAFGTSVKVGLKAGGLFNKIGQALDGAKNWIFGGGANRAAQAAVTTPGGGIDQSGQGWNRSWTPPAGGGRMPGWVFGRDYGPGSFGKGTRRVYPEEGDGSGSKPPVSNPPPQAPPAPQAPDVSHIPTGTIPPHNIYGGTPESGPAWYDGKQTHLGTPPWLDKSKDSAPPTSPTLDPNAPMELEIVDVPLLPPEETGLSEAPPVNSGHFTTYIGSEYADAMNIDIESILPPDAVYFDGSKVSYKVGGEMLSAFDYKMKALEKGRSEAASRAVSEGHVASIRVEIEVIEKNLNEAHQQLDQRQKENNAAGIQQAQDRIHRLEGELKDAQQRYEGGMSEVHKFDVALDEHAKSAGFQSYEDYLKAQGRLKEKEQKRISKAPSKKAAAPQQAPEKAPLQFDGLLGKWARSSSGSHASMSDLFPAGSLGTGSTSAGESASSSSD